MPTETIIDARIRGPGGVYALQVDVDTRDGEVLAVRTTGPASGTLRLRISVDGESDVVAMIPSGSFTLPVSGKFLRDTGDRDYKAWSVSMESP